MHDEGNKRPDHTCTRCGNGVLDDGEQCEVHGLGCNSTCGCVAPMVSSGSANCTKCGNHVQDPGEQCDRSAGCSSNCTCMFPTVPAGNFVCTLCGNKQLDAGEQCDGSIGCGANCFCLAGWRPAPYGCTKCGNLVVDAGEMCDGTLGCDATCHCSSGWVLDKSTNNTCTRCGNGVVDDWREECDDNSSTCFRCKCVAGTSSVDHHCVGAAAADQRLPCPGLSQDRCAGNQSCAWCPSSSTCTLKQLSSACQQCSFFDFSREECTDRAGCSCNADRCPSCSSTPKGACTAGCQWCAPSLSCMDESSTECSCSAKQSRCSDSPGCHNCTTLHSCMASVDSCPTCLSYASASECTHSGCLWCNVTALCLPSGQRCVECADIGSEFCTRFASCKLCGGICRASSSPCTKKSNSDTVLVAAIVPSVCGGVLILACIIVVIVAVGRRRKSKQKQQERGVEMTLERSFIDLPDESVPVDSEAAGSLPFSVHPSSLVFSCRSSPLEVGSTYTKKLTIKSTASRSNSNSATTSISVHQPEPTGTYVVGVDPRSADLGPGEEQTVTVSLKPLCTTTVDASVAVRVAGSREFVAVAVRAEVAISNFLDWNELEVEKRVGEGGFGVVYKAEWRRQTVAVKEFKAMMIELEEFRADAQREMDISCRIRSPYLICTFGFVFNPQHLAIVMEYAPMGSLDSYIARHALESGLKPHIALDVSKGMEFLHANGILHRDLKTENILVFSLSPKAPVRVKISDFGTSRLIGSEEASKDLTKGIGTPLYQSPEVMTSSPYGCKSDVYSFGMLVYVLYAETHPFVDM
eukprot:m51a1_g12678 putative protein serine threonine (806) ;mRNA; r:118-3810